jgi:DNA polymerase (family 10)
MDKGVKISVNPDAHSVEGIHDIHYGILAARKGGLTKEFLFNAMHAAEMDVYLRKRKADKLQII